MIAFVFSEKLKARISDESNVGGGVGVLRTEWKICNRREGRVERLRSCTMITRFH